MGSEDKKNSGKAPSIQWYFKDWLADDGLKLCSYGAKGLWIDIISQSVSMEIPGVFSKNNCKISEQKLLEMFGGKMSEKRRFFTELKQWGVIKQTEEEVFYVKRVKEDMELREKRRAAGKLGGNPKLVGKKVKQEVKQNSNQKATPSSSTSSSTSINNKKKVYKEDFEKARIIYPGTKRGLDTEFNYFCKIHSDWLDVLSLLEPAINNQISHKRSLKSAGKFCPEWKNFKTWIYNRCWEEEVKTQVVDKQEKIEKQREEERRQYTTLFMEWSQADYDGYVNKYGHHLDWLWNEVKGAVA